MFETLIHQPRKLWLRRALFQVHLWLGIALVLYGVVISLSGSILVFEDEIRQASLHRESLGAERAAALSSVVAQAQARFPGRQLTYVGFPQNESPWWALYLSDPRGHSTVAYADARTGAPLALQRRLFIDWVLDLHVYLLAGRSGFIANCIAGIGILLLAISGFVLWWPGIRTWKTALLVSLGSGWKRINYDLHNVVGIWTLLLVSWWGITAVYFLLPEQVGSVVNAISPLVGMKPPDAASAAAGNAVVPLDTLAAELPALAPGAVSGIGLPDKPGGVVTAYVDTREPGDFSHRDIVTLDGHTGKPLSIWHYGEKHSLGDWFLWLLYPLHFGTVWGLGVKILWSAFGLSICLLSITGLLMYWNRKLSKLLRPA